MWSLFPIRSDLEEEILPLLVQTAAENNLLIADEARYICNTKTDRRRQWLMEEIVTGHKIIVQGRQEDYSVKKFDRHCIQPSENIAA